MLFTTALTEDEALDFVQDTQLDGHVPMIVDRDLNRGPLLCDAFGMLTRVELATVALRTGCTVLREALASKRCVVIVRLGRAYLLGIGGLSAAWLPLSQQVGDALAAQAHL